MGSPKRAFSRMRMVRKARGNRAPMRDAPPHNGQNRARFFLKRVGLKYDVFDRIVGAS